MVMLTHTVFLPGRDLLDVGDRAGHDLVKPASTSGDGADQACTALDPGRANFVLDAMREADLPGLPGRSLLPRNRERVTIPHLS